MALEKHAADCDAPLASVFASDGVEQIIVDSDQVLNDGCRMSIQIVD